MGTGVRPGHVYASPNGGCFALRMDDSSPVEITDAAMLDARRRGLGGGDVSAAQFGARLTFTAARRWLVWTGTPCPPPTLKRRL